MSARPASDRRFIYHDLDVRYSLIRSARTTIGLHIYPDGRVIVRAPHGIGQSHIDAVLTKRADWLRTHLARLAAAPPVSNPAPPRYETGASIAYLGQTLTLMVTPGSRSRAQRSGDELHVVVPAGTSAEAMVMRWLKHEAERVFEARLAVCFDPVRAWGKPVPALRVRTMKTRWGSCSATGSITLNTRLLHLPVDLIDYVILHELCHLREMNHSPRFYALMTQVCPNWRQQRARMKQIAL